ncbi:MAG: AbrB/MazE/SpoVT family DNA-binding domain-containing protein [bacterium]
MKATGIVRKIDKLGRIVIPRELRRTMNIDEADDFEIYVEEDTILLKKHKPACYFCGSMESTIEFKGDLICSNCIEKLSGLEKEMKAIQEKFNSNTDKSA